MATYDNNASMADLFVFEAHQLVEQLERLILDSEKCGGAATVIDEVFRIMHTLKGGAAMMSFHGISSVAHSLEDVFYYLRENGSTQVNDSELTDLVLDSVDFIKGQVRKIENGEKPDDDCLAIREKNREYLAKLQAGSTILLNDPAKKMAESSEPQNDGGLNSQNCKTRYEATVYFEEECGMENIRAFSLVHELSVFSEDIEHWPKAILENEDTAEEIKKDGFKLAFTTPSSLEKLQDFFSTVMFLKKAIVQPSTSCSLVVAEPEKAVTRGTESRMEGAHQFISVNVAKMDMLMDLVGELVIAEAMVTQNPELQGLKLDTFYKSVRQLRKITSELQANVMSIRMVPLAGTFVKLNRIVRDMVRKLNKQANLEIAGQETEVDKNIIESIADPLMHLIRNAMDHGIEPVPERLARGKPAAGNIRLEAKNTGGDVWIIVQDDGRGLSKEKIFNKALERGLIHKGESSLSDSQIYSFLFHPGFSTSDTVTEFSGRGVGMDVVAKNIEKIGGAIHIDSAEGEGTAISIRIPLTLAIIDGMNVKVGKSIYTIPITAIQESFRLREQPLIKDTANNEMVMIRGKCYPVLRLYERFKVAKAVEDLREGIMIMVEAGERKVCLFADSLLGQQQVVVKALPAYIKTTRGIVGCSLLGDGGVSLILDVAGLAF